MNKEALVFYFIRFSHRFIIPPTVATSRNLRFHIFSKIHTLLLPKTDKTKCALKTQIIVVHRHSL